MIDLPTPMRRDQKNQTTTLEQRLLHTNLKYFGGMLLAGIGAYMVGSAVPPELSKESATYNFFSYGLLLAGGGLSINAFVHYNDMSKPRT